MRVPFHPNKWRRTIKRVLERAPDGSALVAFNPFVEMPRAEPDAGNARRLDVGTPLPWEVVAGRAGLPDAAAVHRALISLEALGRSRFPAEEQGLATWLDGHPSVVLPEIGALSSFLLGPLAGWVAELGCQTVVLEAPVLGDLWEGPPEELSRFPWVEGWDPTRMYDPDGRFFGTAEDDLATPIFYAEPEVIERLGRRIEGRTAGPETTLIWSIDGSVGG